VGIVLNREKEMDESSASEVENKLLIARLFEDAIHQGKLTVVDEVFSSDFIDHSTPDQATGPAGVKAYFVAVRTGFPDIRVSIDDMIAEGDRVVVCSTWRGTHKGTYAGIAPTGGGVARTLMQIFRVVDGKIVEEWNEGGDLINTSTMNA
jgi:predicted ester cyclase